MSIVAEIQADAVPVVTRSPRKSDAQVILILVMVSMPLFLASSFFRDLFSPDEPRYAAISREMLETGNWVLPHLNGTVYTEKPPLHFWLTALSARLWGNFSTFSLVFPSALAAIGCLIVTYFFGKRLFNRDVGIIGSVVLGTSMLFFMMAQFLRMDMLFTFLLTSALFAFWLGYDQGGAKPVYYLFFYVLLALTFLTKGPVGMVLAFASITIYLGWRKDFRALWRIRPFTGACLILLVAGPWLMAALREGGWEYLQILIIKQSFVRGYDSWDNDQPFYFYAPYLPAVFFPWFPFLIGAFAYQAGANKSGQRSDRTAFLIIWTVTGFIFFSLMSGKMAVYLLPLIPTASILIAHFWHSSITSKRTDRRLSLCLSASGYALWIAGIIIGVALLCGLRLKIIGMPNQIVGGVFLCLGVLGLGMWRLDWKKAALITAMVSTPLSTLVSIWTLVPIANARQSLSPLGSSIALLRQAHEPVGMYQCDRPSLYFYTGDPIAMLKSENELLDFLSSEERVLCVIDEVEFGRLAKRISRRDTAQQINWLAGVELNGKKLVIVSQYP